MGSGEMSTPTLPDGFVLEGAQPPLPDGFVLESGAAPSPPPAPRISSRPPAEESAGRSFRYAAGWATGVPGRAFDQARGLLGAGIQGARNVADTAMDAGLGRAIDATAGGIRHFDRAVRPGAYDENLRPPIYGTSEPLAKTAGRLTEPAVGFAKDVISPPPEGAAPPPLVAGFYEAASAGRQPSIEQVEAAAAWARQNNAPDDVKGAISYWAKQYVGAR